MVSQRCPRRAQRLSTPKPRPRLFARCGLAGDKARLAARVGLVRSLAFLSILLREIQTQEPIVFGGEIQAGPVAGETRNNAAMFLAEPGRFKGLTKVLPPRAGVGGQTRALQRRQRVDRGREGTDSLLNALIGRRQLELGVERFEVMTKLLSKCQGMIGCGRNRFRHGGSDG